MANVIAICNQKGGVGKSTTAVNLGSYLAISGKRTLLVDMDPQGNATTACGIDRRTLGQTIYSILVDGTPAAEAIVKTQIPNLDLVPASLDLAGAEPFLTNANDRETILRRAFDSTRAAYDFILFDCPPSLNMLTVNALVAADRTIIPVQCEYLALEGLNSLMQAVNLVKQKLNPSLRVGGIVLTMTDFRANLTREVASEVRGFFKNQVFSTAIPRNIRLAEAPSYGKPICLYDPHSTGAMAYQVLAKEVIERHDVEQQL